MAGLINFIFLLMLSSCLISCCYSTDFPSDIIKCKFNDDDCFKSSLEYLLRTYAAIGNKKLGLEQLDPLRIKKLHLGKNVKSPISVELIFNNVDLLGMAQLQVNKFTSDNSTIEMDLLSPNTLLKGPYIGDGKILLLPVVGKGNAEIQLKNLKMHGIVHLRYFKNNDGKTHVEVSNMFLDMFPERMTCKLDGLFNGNKELSDNLHKVINENWQLVFNELKTDISKAIALEFTEVINNLFKKHPVEWYFADVQ